MKDETYTANGWKPVREIIAGWMERHDSKSITLKCIDNGIFYAGKCIEGLTRIRPANRLEEIERNDALHNFTIRLKAFKVARAAFVRALNASNEDHFTKVWRMAEASDIG